MFLLFIKLYINYTQYLNHEAFNILEGGGGITCIILYYMYKIISKNITPREGTWGGGGIKYKILLLLYF